MGCCYCYLGYIITYNTIMIVVVVIVIIIIIIIIDIMSNWHNQNIF